MNVTSEALHWYLEQQPVEGPCLWLGAEQSPALALLPELSCWQPHRGRYRELGKKGWPMPAGKFALAVVSAAPSREETLARLGAASARAEQTLLVCANKLGAAGYERHLPPWEVWSKHKCRMYLFSGGEFPFALEVQKHGDFWTAPGLFSWDRIDPGSRLLARTLPGRMAGKVGDFGAGWGYLSWELAERGVNELHVLEVDARGIEACRQNLAGRDLESVHYHWKDLTFEGCPATNLDWAIVNPPFHQDGIRTQQLGQKIIEVALASLKKGGQLWMVSNATLPYERVLGPDCQLRASADGFKVLSLVRS